MPLAGNLFFKMSSSLTKHLLTLQISPPYSLATQHTFLTQAGKGNLPHSRLALWLSQDRIYAGHAYPCFIGALISRIPFHQADAIFGPKEQHNQKILTILVKCLDNIVQEIGFFGEVAGKWNLNMEGFIERKGTRDYTAEMARISSSGSFTDGLIFLWAMERVSFSIKRS
jgi:thiaminase